MNKITYKNYNPENKRAGDCVIRAFAAYFDKELDYNTIKKEIQKYGKNPNDYQIRFTFDQFANEANMVRINTDKYTKNVVTTFNRAIEFAKQFKIGMVCISNNHAVYVDDTNGLVDTWDSRGKHMKYFYIHRDDAKLIGLKIEDSKTRYTAEVDDRSTWIIREGSQYSIKSKK